MPFTKLPMTPGDSLELDHLASRLSTKTTARIALNDPIKLSLSHITNERVRLAVEYLESPYPQLEIQCPPSKISTRAVVI